MSTVSNTAATAVKYSRRERPFMLKGATYRIETPFGTAYITVNKTDNDNEPFELFLNVGKGGTDVAAICEGYGRLVSWILRSASDMSPTERLKIVAAQLENIGGANPHTHWPQPDAQSARRAR